MLKVTKTNRYRWADPYFSKALLLIMDLIEHTISGFLLLHKTSDGSEHIYCGDHKTLLLKDGVFRSKFTNGSVCYGTRVIAKSVASGEEDKEWRLKKFADGDIHYQVKIWVEGQDKGWRIVTKYKFDPTSLEWTKLK